MRSFTLYDKWSDQVYIHMGVVQLLFVRVQSDLSILYLAEEVEIGQVLAGIQYLAVEEVNGGHWLDMDTDHLTVMYQWVGQILQKIYCGYH